MENTAELSEEQVVRALGALAQGTRLRLFRALVVAGQDGLSAGSLSGSLEIAPSALSFHLKELSHAGLIASRQNGRFMIYTARYDSMNALLGFLTKNCCQGTASDCTPDAACASPACLPGLQPDCLPKADPATGTENGKPACNTRCSPARPPSP